MTRVWAIRLLALVGSLGFVLSFASADAGSAVADQTSSNEAMPIAANLTGFNEVPPILTNGKATFRATLSATSLTYTLTFSGLTSTSTQAHLHFAERGVNGGVFVFLCSNVGTPAGITTPACPANGGTVTGTLTAADVIAIGPTATSAGQNVTAGDFAGLRRIIQSGDAYANVHSQNFKAGEVRGQVHFGDD
jgi:hypothetical protein